MAPDHVDGARRRSDWPRAPRTCRLVRNSRGRSRETQRKPAGTERRYGAHGPGRRLRCRNARGFGRTDFARRMQLQFFSVTRDSKKARAGICSHCVRSLIERAKDRLQPLASVGTIGSIFLKVIEIERERAGQLRLLLPRRSAAADTRLVHASPRPLFVWTTRHVRWTANNPRDFPRTMSCGP